MREERGTLVTKSAICPDCGLPPAFIKTSSGPARVPQHDPGCSLLPGAQEACDIVALRQGTTARYIGNNQGGE